MGNSVILDASFSKKQYRDMVKEKLKEQDIPIFFIETDSPKKTIMKRLFERRNNIQFLMLDWKYFMNLKNSMKNRKNLIKICI